MSIDTDRRFVLTTPEHGWENLSGNLKSLGFNQLKAISLSDASDQLNRLSYCIFALAIPSLANVDAYENLKKVESLIDDAVILKVARIGVVSMFTSFCSEWQYKSSADTIVRVVKSDDSDRFFMEYARFLTGLREDL